MVKSNNLTYNNTKGQSAIPSWYVLTLTNKIIEFAQAGFQEQTLFQIRIASNFQNQV
jgi:hypothetical protein